MPGNNPTTTLTVLRDVFSMGGDHADGYKSGYSTHPTEKRCRMFGKYGGREVVFPEGSIASASPGAASRKYEMPMTLFDNIYSVTM